MCIFISALHVEQSQQKNQQYEFFSEILKNIDITMKNLIYVFYYYLMKYFSFKMASNRMDVLSLSLSLHQNTWNNTLGSLASCPGLGLQTDPSLLSTDAVVMQANGRPRGFGFVTFENGEQAEYAFQHQPGHLIDGKMVVLPTCLPLHPSSTFNLGGCEES